MNAVGGDVCQVLCVTMHIKKTSIWNLIAAIIKSIRMSNAVVSQQSKQKLIFL